MIVIAVCNQKGGVGKTTTTVHLARALQVLGIRTLVVDMDPQAATSATLLGDLPDPAAMETVADLLSRHGRAGITPADVIRRTGWDHVDVVPSGVDTLADVQDELVIAKSGREHKLREAFSGLTGYDAVLIDCPPQLDQLTVNSLVWADRALIITTAALYSLNGMVLLLRTFAAVREYNGSHVEPVGIMVNSFLPRVRQKHWLSTLRSEPIVLRDVRDGVLVAEFTIPVWEDPIPDATWIATATESGMGLDEWAAHKEVSRDERERAGEVMAIYLRYARRLVGLPELAEERAG